MSHLGTGGDSYRLVPSAESGGIGMVTNERTTPTSPGGAHHALLDFLSQELGSVQASDREEVRRGALHEAAHVIATFSCGWDVEFADAARGQTKVLEPDYDSLGIVERHHIRALIAAAPAALCGLHSEHEYNDDRRAVREAGYVWEDVLAEVAQLRESAWFSGVFNGLSDALIEAKRLEREDLVAIWNG